MRRDMRVMSIGKIEALDLESGSVISATSLKCLAHNRLLGLGSYFVGTINECAERHQNAH
jgi:hypothetical protein